MEELSCPRLDLRDDEALDVERLTLARPPRRGKPLRVGRSVRVRESILRDGELFDVERLSLARASGWRGVFVSERLFCATVTFLTSRWCPLLALRAGIPYRTQARRGNASPKRERGTGAE